MPLYQQINPVTATGSSTPRTLAAWLSDPVNILAFGATGGNVTADTDGLVAAITAAGYGGIIRIPRTASAYLFDPTTITASVGGVRRIKIDATGATITPGSACAVFLDLQASESEFIGFNIEDPTGLADVVLRLKKTVAGGIDNFRMQISNWYGAGVASGTQKTFIQIDGADTVHIDDLIANNFDKGIEVLDGGVSSLFDRVRTRGGKYGIILNTVTGDAEAQAEGLVISRAELLPTQANSIAMQIKNGLQFVVRDSILDGQYATGGVGLDVDGTDGGGKGIDGLYVSDTWIAGAPSATACKVRGTTADISFDSVRFAGDNTANSTAGLTVDACPSITVRNSNTRFLSGVSAAFSGGSVGLVENCNFDGGTAPTESSDCAIVWDTDHDVPATRAILSSYPRSEWTAYTPTYFSTGGTITTYTATMRWRRDGKNIDFQSIFTLTTNGTGSGVIIGVLPIAPKLNVAQVFSAVNLTDVLGLTAYAGGADAGFAIVKPDGSYPGVSGRTYYISGTYEVA